MGTEHPDIPITITYLEMTSPPSRTPPPPPAIPTAILRAEEPTVSFYRYLYNTVGAPWTWTEIRKKPDEEVQKTIHDPNVSVMVLYVRGVPAGFAQFDFRDMPTAADLNYFGLIPDFIGRGLGPWFLHWAIGELWSRNPDRVTLNTCTEDHPSALGMYQKAGFVPYDRKEAFLTPMAAFE